MSNESCWPSPPLSRITITDLARPGVAPAAAAARRREQARQAHPQEARVTDLEERPPRREGPSPRFKPAHVHLLRRIAAQPQQRPPTPNDTLKSAEVAPDRKVTFRIYAPKADEVSVSRRLRPRRHDDQG